MQALAKNAMDNQLSASAVFQRPLILNIFTTTPATQHVLMELLQTDSIVQPAMIQFSA